MPATLTPTTMTTAELLAMPDDGMERWLIDGELREKPMTIRNRFHNELLITIGMLLGIWRKSQPKPRGKVLGGEAGVRLSEGPDSTVGIDVLYIDAETAARQDDDTTIISGVPVLIVEISSPSERTDEINEKLDKYRSVGVSLVWLVDPHDQTVTVYLQKGPPQLFAVGQEISGDPFLPGLRVSVSEIFDC